VACILASLLITTGVWAACPDPGALSLFRHQIAYETTEEAPPLRGQGLVHANVWMRGPVTGFYIREPLKGFVPKVRMSYLFGEDGPIGGGTCSVEKDWRECLAQFADQSVSGFPIATCTATIDIRSIRPWEPSADDEQKRRVASELRLEIEAKWHGAQEIVIRDFDLKDPQIVMYLKMTDGDYYQGCGFHAGRERHCEGWHSFGQAPVSKLRRWIFARPSRLK